MVSKTMAFQVKVSGLSDMGLVRQNNEDCWASLFEGSMLLLADGMGGHQAGEVAAREAVQSLGEMAKNWATKNLSPQKVAVLLTEAIVEVNEHVYGLSRSDDLLRGMGTTLCVLYFLGSTVIVGNVGDSRIYRLRDKQFVQITKDHSLVRELIDMGQLSEEQAQHFLYKNIITRAIGTDPDVVPSVEIEELVEGDLFLMCSDGLSDLLTCKQMEALLNKAPSIEEACHALVSAAKERGGYDNITVVIATVQNQR